eukprot:6556529-Pyramimonas_sp.AAC.1
MQKPTDISRGTEQQWISIRSAPMRMDKFVDVVVLAFRLGGEWLAWFQNCSVRMLPTRNWRYVTQLYRG